MTHGSWPSWQRVSYNSITSLTRGHTLWGISVGYNWRSRERTQRLTATANLSAWGNNVTILFKHNIQNLRPKTMRELPRIEEQKGGPNNLLQGPFYCFSRDQFNKYLRTSESISGFERIALEMPSLWQRTPWKPDTYDWFTIGLETEQAANPHFSESK